MGKVQMEETKGNIGKWLLAGLAGTIFLEPLGKLIRDFLWSAQFDFVKHHLDYLFKWAAKGDPNFGLNILQFVLISMIMMLLYTAFAHEHVSLVSKKIAPFDSEKVENFFVVTLKVMTIFITFMGVLKVFDITFVSKVSRSLQTSITIVSPYIDDRQKKLLLSNAASMAGRSDYQALVEKITNIAAINHVKLDPTLFSTIPDFLRPETDTDED